MENKEQTALDWFYDKIKSHFTHDGDLFEVVEFTYQIAKRKEKAEPKNNNWGVGDKVRITKNKKGHGYNIGDIVELIDYDGSDGMWLIKNEEECGYWITEEEAELVMT